MIITQHLLCVCIGCLCLYLKFVVHVCLYPAFMVRFMPVTQKLCYKFSERFRPITHHWWCTYWSIIVTTPHSWYMNSERLMPTPQYSDSIYSLRLKPRTTTQDACNLKTRMHASNAVFTLWVLWRLHVSNQEVLGYVLGGTKTCDLDLWYKYQ